MKKKNIGFLLLLLVWGGGNLSNLSAEEKTDHREGVFVSGEEAPVQNPQFLDAPFHRNASAYGIDVSKYQGIIEWEQVQNYGSHPVEFMYAKASQGVTIRDDFYRRNMAEARRQGILVGSYHYFSSGGTGVEQCDYFIETMEGIPQDLIPVVDVEECSKSWGALTLRRNLRDFINRMEQAYGVKPIIYTGVFFYNLYLSEEFKDCKLFLARYADEEPRTNDGADWVIWQFTERGEIDGIRHKVDIDCINSKYSLEDILISAKEIARHARHPLKVHVPPNALPADAGME